MSLAVWVTRPTEGSGDTARVVRDAGFHVHAFPVLKVETVSFSLPADPPDVVIFVSANAARALERSGEGLADAKRRARTVCVGRKTALAARDLGWDVAPVPGVERAAGLVRGIQGWQLSGRRVWIPRGNREGSARGEIPRFLLEAGATVEGFDVYRVTQRVLPPGELASLHAQPPQVTVVHSPSAATTLFRGGQASALAGILGATRFLAIGPTTGSRLAELGSPRVDRCSRPDDAAIVEQLRTFSQETAP